VETAKTDADGKAIHEECYALNVKFENAKKSTHDGRADEATDGAATRPWKVVAQEVARRQIVIPGIRQSISFSQQLQPVRAIPLRQPQNVSWL
jgi:hypothetical protein